MILGILQARMSSTRLPGKVMADVQGQQMIVRQMERLARSERLNALVVATSDDPSDDVLADWCRAARVPLHRGPLHDVLGRFAGVLGAYPQAQTVVRMTADCPLADWRVVDDVIGQHLETGADYTSNVVPTRSYPHGLDIEVAKVAALLQAASEATDPHDREHVTPFLYRRPKRYRIANVVQEPDLSALRWTVDLPSDLEFVRGVYAALYPKNPAFTTEDVVALPVNSAPIP
jgi:spore coat polysaccharide biosynthesis protein SpsF